MVFKDIQAIENGENKCVFKTAFKKNFVCVRENNVCSKDLIKQGYRLFSEQVTFWPDRLSMAQGDKTVTLQSAFPVSQAWHAGVRLDPSSRMCSSSS